MAVDGAGNFSRKIAVNKKYKVSNSGNEVYRNGKLLQENDWQQDIVIVKQQTRISKSKDHFKRRITHVHSAPKHLEKLLRTAIYEYEGTDPVDDLPHGNAIKRVFVKYCKLFHYFGQGDCHVAYFSACNTTLVLVFLI